MPTITRQVYRAGELIGEDTVDVPAETVNADALHDRARQALRSNRNYLANPSLTAADVRTQVDRLTRQNQALIRLVVGLLDDTD